MNATNLLKFLRFATGVYGEPATVGFREPPASPGDTPDAPALVLLTKSDMGYVERASVPGIDWPALTAQVLAEDARVQQAIIDAEMARRNAEDAARAQHQAEVDAIRAAVSAG